MGYKITLQFAFADDFARLMVVLAKEDLTANIAAITADGPEPKTMKMAKPAKADSGARFYPPEGQGILDQAKEVRTHMRNGKEVEGYKRGPRTNRPPGPGFRVVMARAAERGKSGFNRMGTMLLFLSQAGGSATSKEIRQYLTDEGLEPHGNPIIAITTRGLAMSDGKGAIQITPDGAQYLAQLMAEKRGS